MTSPLDAPRRHTLSIHEALARTGVKGGQVPALTGGLQQVIVMADYSKSFSGEPLEARGVASVAGFAIPGATRGYSQLNARAPGGALVEAFHFLQTNGNNLSWLDRSAVAVTPTASSALASVETGGEAVGSACEVGHTLDLPSGAVADWSNSFASGIALNGPLRFYVPPGAFLRVISDVLSPGGVGALLYCSFFWRELPEPIGLP